MENIRKLDGQQIGKLLEILLEKSFEAVIITDADPHDHRILYANSRFCQMTGYNKDELYGHSPRMLSGPRTSRKVLDRLKEALLTGEHFVGATTNYRKNGTAYPVQWNIYPITDDKGQPEFFVSIQKDLTTLKRSLTRLKSSSQYFRNFLLELEQSKASSTVSVDTQAISEAEQALKDNVEVLAEYVNTNDLEQDIGDDDDFFDFDDLVVDSDADDEEIQQPKISATDFLASTTIDSKTVDDVKSIATSLKRFADNYDLQDLYESDRKEFIEELQEMANAIFFIEEFMDISVSISELTVGMYHNYENPFDMIIAESLKGMINDLHTWTDEVFVQQTSEDIHWLDNSIIGSCKQTLVFLRMK